MAGSILVVEDEPSLHRSLRANLVARGYGVVAVETGEDALAQLAECQVDLVILDLMLPGLSGLDVCRAVREHANTPILILSGHGEEHIKVRALDLGADDYLTKPFGINELLARVRALLRRQTSPAAPAEILSVGPFVVDLDSRRGLYRGRTLDLTHREFEILVYLLRHPGQVLTHRQLLHAVWGPEYDTETQYLRVFVNRLRRKIEPDPANPRHILTEIGIGYRLVAAEPSQDELADQWPGEPDGGIASHAGLDCRRAAAGAPDPH
jgi:two-component system KDP operon response regulator KdpE